MKKLNMKKAVRTVPCFVDAGQGPRQRSSPLLGGLLLAASLGLSACGGSGASNLSVSARVEGLREAGLVLSLTPQSAAFAIAPNASSHTFFDVVPNFSHDITVRKHPLNQLCQVVNGRGTAGSAAAQGASIVCQRTLLNDTGSELADDGGEGRDAVVASTLTKVGSGDKGFDFTRLCVKDAGGAVEVCKGPLPKSTADVNAAVSADPGGWVCTRDNVTGLVWRVHDPAGNDGLCGIPAGEWFLPSSHELASVLDLGRFNPALSQDYLPHLGSENYQVTMSGGTFFYLQAGDGTVAKGLALPVMVARSKALTSSFTQVSKPEDRLFVSGSLELMWHLPASPAQATYEQARSDAAALKVGGHNDWRLPNQKELMSLFDRDHGCVTEGCVPLAYLPPDSAAGEAFWSSTVFAGDVIPANSDKSRWLLAPVAGGFTTEFRSPYLSGRAIFVRNLSGDEVPGP
ncbi:MAG: DUF1566 domain-containing protein [Hydrogenophaga sp.]|uniref:Lcl domain-containing protein n=1 Tax=Hydrogenophaga sp. TaxID=1904254 RepID=UPI002638CA65|nr:DUF1566 domain-containing protein [Hydrogenophaga sp.]MDM7942442.1 DUF1566 domain-containing protein [Hydrogenophaga sp.]